MLISSHYRPIENGFLGVKKGMVTPGKNTLPGTNLPPKHVFGYIERQATLLMVSCRCVEGTKRKYIFLSFFISLYKKSVHGDNFTHTPAPRSFFNSHQFWHVGSYGGRNQPCKLCVRWNTFFSAKIGGCLKA